MKYLIFPTLDLANAWSANFGARYTQIQGVTPAPGFRYSDAMPLIDGRYAVLIVDWAAQYLTPDEAAQLVDIAPDQFVPSPGPGNGS